MPEETFAHSGSSDERGGKSPHETDKDDSKQETRNKKQETNGKTQEAQKRRDTQEKKRQDEIEKRREEVTKNREKKFGKEKTPLIPFEEAKKNLETLSIIQDEAKDEKGRKVVIPPKELKNFKQVLEDHGGYSQKDIEKMSVGDIIATVQEVYKQAKVADPKASDLSERESSKRKTEERFLKSTKDKVLNAGEEVLISAKVEGYLEVSDTDELMDSGEGKGVGAMEAGGVLVEQINVREVIAKLKFLERKRLAGEVLTPQERQIEVALGVGLSQAIDEFNNNVDELHYMPVHEFCRVIDDMVYTSENYEPPLPDGRSAVEILNEIISPEQRADFESKRKDLDEYFEEKYVGMSNRLRDIVLGDIERSAGVELQGLLGGWRDPENVKAYFFGGAPYRDAQGRLQAANGLVYENISRELGLGLDGIREWRAIKEIYGVEEQVSIEFLTRPPARWQEVPERISNIYRFIERTDFTVEQLQGYIQKALNMIDKVETEDAEGRKILNDLNKELKAFQGFHSFWVTLRHGSMQPEQVINVFNNHFDDETWVTFASRFSVDARRRLFQAKNESGETVNINLLDETLRLYFETIQNDRKEMNKVEDLTKRKLDLNTNLNYEKWIILKLALGDGFVGTEQNLDELIASLTEEQKAKTKVWGRDIDKSTEVVNEWYRVTTLLGAHGQLKIGVDADGKDVNLDLLADRRYALRVGLANRLVDLGLTIKGDERSTEKIIEDLLNEGFLEAVESNAYNLAWSLAWSDFDIIRIYGINGQKVKDKSGFIKEVPRAIAFNQDTNLFYGRHIDHFLDFAVDEERGRGYESTETNAILRKHMLGNRGNILPQNRFMVRVARYFMTKEQTNDVDRRVNEMIRDYDFVPDESYRKLVEGEESRDSDDPKRDAYFKGFSGWARSAVIADMIDNGELDFTQKMFSKVAGGIRKFEMIDIYSDRNLALKYFSREALQGYLREPSNERFLKINDKDSAFYSGRNIRLWPWMILAYQAHWEMSHKYRKKLLNKDDMQSAEGEALVDTMVADGLVKKEQGNYLMHETLGVGKGVLGTVPFRRLRQSLDTVGFATKESLWTPLPLPVKMGFGMAWDFITKLFAYSFGQFQGR